MHSSPALDKIIGNSAPIKRPLEADGWSWLCGIGADGKSTGVHLTPAIQELVEARLFEERNLDPDELRQVQLATMTHAQTACSRLIDRAMLLRMLGVQEFRLEQSWDSVFPCLRFVSSATGEAGVEGTPGSQACGERRWCVNCEAVALMLLNTPPAPLLTDVCCAWLRTCMTNWFAQD